MKRWITLMSSALLTMAVASPLFAGDGKISATAPSANQSSKNPASQSGSKAASAQAGPSVQPTMRTGTARNMRRAGRIDELKKIIGPQRARPASSEIENRMLPDRLKDRSNRTRANAPSSSAAPAQAPQAPVGQSPSADLSFGGYDSDDNATLFGFRIMPPDTNGDVGREHYVQWNNLGFKIFDKAGTDLTGPLPGNIFWAGTGGACEFENDGDPIVIYDHIAGRWVFTQFEIPNGGTSSGLGLACFAVSDGESPGGPYTTWEFDIALVDFNDYPKMGLWVTDDGSQSAYHMTTNEFASTGGFVGVAFTAFDRDAILAGDPGAGFQQLLPGPEYFGVQPPNLEGATLPPAGTCAPYIQAWDDQVFGDGTGPDGYQVWEFCTDFDNGVGAGPSAPTLAGPFFVETTLPFDATCLGTFGSCVPQPNGQLLDALTQFTMYRFSVRMLDGALSGVISHSVTTTPPNDGPPPPPSTINTVDIAAVESWDGLGDPSNTILGEMLGSGVPVVIDGVGWDLSIETVGGSWLSEASHAIGPAGGAAGVFLSPGGGDGFPGSASYSSGGIIDLASNGIPVIGIPDGMAQIEFYESFDDVGDAVDAIYPDGTISISYYEGTPPPPPLITSQWARLRLTDGPTMAAISPALMDTGVVDVSDGLNRWMPSVSQDSAGNMGIVYSRSGSGATDFPSVYYAGREATDGAGTLQAESTCVDGTGSQAGGDRWGDYASVSVDPVDECTFWVTNEYVEVTGSFDWDTQICSFSFDSCGEEPPPGDADGDGVTDDVDACPATVWPDAYPTTGRLGRGRYTLEEPPEFTKSEGRVTVPDYSLADTNGCSCDQLVDGGHYVGSLSSNQRRGCTKGTMDNAPSADE